MSEEKLLTVRDVSILLGISEREVVELVENGTLPAYKVGGVYLRFKKEQVLNYKKELKPFSAKPLGESIYSFNDRISDFFYFNDFYILCVIIVILLLVMIFRGY